METENTQPKVTLILPEGTNEFTIREGEAIPPKEKERVQLIGTIVSPRVYSQNRTIDKTTALIIINDNREKSEILLICEQNEKLTDTVTGKIEIHPILKEIPVNNDKKMGVTDLRLWVRQNAHLFADFSEHAALTANLVKFKTKVDTVFKDEKDNKTGNSLDLLEKTVESDLQKSFMLCLPILKGGNKEAFKVEILLQASGNSIVVWFESNELKKLLSDQIDKQISEEKKYFEDNGYCIIYKA